MVDKRTLTTAGVEYARVTRIIRLQNMHVEFRRIRTSARARVMLGRQHKNKQKWLFKRSRRKRIRQAHIRP